MKFCQPILYLYTKKYYQHLKSNSLTTLKKMKTCVYILCVLCMMRYHVNKPSSRIQIYWYWMWWFWIIYHSSQCNCVLHLWVYSDKIYSQSKCWLTPAKVYKTQWKNSFWFFVCAISKFSWTGGRCVSNKYSQSYGFKWHFVRIVEVCIHGIVPSVVLRLCPKHRDGEYIRYIAKLYVN